MGGTRDREADDGMGHPRWMEQGVGQVEVRKLPVIDTRLKTSVCVSELRNTDDMDELAMQFLGKLRKVIGKDKNVQNWQVYQDLKSDLETFRNMRPGCRIYKPPVSMQDAGDHASSVRRHA